MSGSNEWRSQPPQPPAEVNRPNIQSYRQQQHDQPPVLPPPASLENRPPHFYALPSLPSFGKSQPSHMQQRFNIPPLNEGPNIHQPKPEPQPSPPVSHSQPQPPLAGAAQSSASLQDIANARRRPSSPGGSHLSYRTLNVKDALTYLDNVKIQYNDQPDIYNKFLDTMKEFKSQVLDTPGVIDRVIKLFRGHPSLIQGFNTFLPPGYRIECHNDPEDRSPIKVTTPYGTALINSQDGTPMGEQPIIPTAAQQQQMEPYFQEHSAPPQPQPPHGYPPGPRPGDAPPQPQPQPHGYPPRPDEAQPQPPHGFPPAPRDDAPHYVRDDAHGFPRDAFGMPPAPGVSSGPVEFNHAITYVNKIKTRFANQPDIYKQFLEILQTYQREQKPIGEVYQHVTLLFQSAPDLLDDFKQFLPDTSANGAPPPMLQPGMEYYAPPQPQLPPVGNFQPAPPGAKDRKKKGSVAHIYETEVQTSDVRGTLAPKKAKEPASPSLLPGVPEPVAAGSKASSLSEEIGFFDKVKKTMGNKQTYNEFLKMLNLYSQDIIDRDTLVERAEGFIGFHKELYEWFKMFVGYDGQPQHIENIAFKKHQLELSLCKACGPSYRKLPKAETYMPCSGRDEMCWEVLNDEWVGHPTWASEDSGFVAHRKNQYEEILFRIEEERHEYDFYMESNLRSIQTLETIANRIANMTPEEKANFKLPPGLGHTSITIYKKVVRKIYGKEKGFEVIDALHENPAIAVPVVLRRLKQKDEEWKRAHREWNKVWREMEQKVFYKSLDHSGLTFKQTDKKLLTTKQLLSELSTIKVEQANKKLNPLAPKPQEQLRYVFGDAGVLADVKRLALVFLRNSQYSAGDKERVEAFIEEFLEVFFAGGIAGSKAANGEAIPSARREASRAGEKPTSEPIESPIDESSKPQKRSISSVSTSLREILKKNKTRSATPESESAEKAGESWIRVAVDTLRDVADPAPTPRHTFNFFCNTTVYVFFRHLRVLYERLEELKAMDAAVGAEIRARTDVQFAKDLDLLSHQMEDMGISINGNDCYAQVLALSERLIEGELEHQWFEEALRQGYRNRAYKLYTVDKVVQGLVKHIHTIITDTKTAEMTVLFENDRQQVRTTAKKQIIYRLQVRSLMGPDENMFKIAYTQTDSSVSMQFVALDDLTVAETALDDQKYSYYVTTYSMAHPTEGIDADSLALPFHKPALDEDEDEDVAGQSSSNMRVKVCQNTFRLFFEEGSSDSFTRNTVYTEPEAKVEGDEKVAKLAKLVKDRLGNMDGRFDALVSGGTAAWASYQGAKVKEEADDTNDDTVNESMVEPNGEPKPKPEAKPEVKPEAKPGPEPKDEIEAGMAETPIGAAKDEDVVME